MTLAVDCDADVTVAVTAPIGHLCPFVDEVDEGTVTISWHAVGKTLEMHTLAACLSQWSACRISHEDLTDQIAASLAAIPGIDAVRVLTRWTTAGMTVEVVAGAVLREPINAEGP